jgi:hypothetical protein
MNFFTVKNSVVYFCGEKLSGLSFFGQEIFELTVNLTNISRISRISYSVFKEKIDFGEN